MYHNGKGIPINFRSSISNFWNYMISKWNIADIHLKDLAMTSTTIFTACLYVKHVILYGYFRYLVFSRTMEILTTLKSRYLKNEPICNFASVDYVLFVTGTENLARLRRAVSEIWCDEKVGCLTPPPPSKSQVKLEIHGKAALLVDRKIPNFKLLCHYVSQVMSCAKC